jgi:glycosyltransferase involved in cell wall biosynthesis
VNVTHLLSSVSRANGGISESVRRLAQSQQATGLVDVSVVSLQDGFTEQDVPRWQPLQPHCCPIRGPRAVGYAPALVPALLNQRADVTHVAGLWMYPSMASLRVAKRTGKPYIVSPHGMLDPWALKNSAWKKQLAARLFERRHLEGAACLQALCAAEANAIRAAGYTNPIFILPNGIDLPDSSTRGSAPVWAGRFPADRRVMLFLGRLHPKKGLRPLVEAWNAMRSTNWQLVIAGWDQGGHLAELELLVQTLNLSDRITFCGPLHGPAKDAAYASAQAFILPSFSEGLPTTVLEAWAHRLPVLMTAACNLPEGFASGAALEISSEPDQLAQSMLLFERKSPSELADMGRRGRILAEEQFNWNRISREMVAVYSWVAGQGPRPPCVHA